MKAPTWFLPLPASLSHDDQRLILDVPGVRILKRKDGTPFAVRGPLNAVDLCDTWSASLDTQARWEGKGPPEPPIWDALITELRARQELRPDALLTPFPWQAEAIPAAALLPGYHFWHPPGTGKTLEATVWGIVPPQSWPVVVVTPAKARHQWAREWARFTVGHAFEIRPAAFHRLRDLSLEEYIQARRGLGGVPDRVKMAGVDRYVTRKIPPPGRIVIVGGLEALADWAPAVVQALRGFRFSLILDEIHRLKSNKRNARVDLPDGTGMEEAERAALFRTQEKEAKERGGFVTTLDGVRCMIVSRDNRAKAAETLARAASRRLATTGTNIFDRLRDLWNQLDLVEAGSVGRYRAEADLAAGKPIGFSDAYCGGRKGTYGGWDDKGATRTPELKQRLARMGHRVDPSVTQKHLPRKQRIIHWIGRDALRKPSPAALRAIATADGSAALLWARLAEMAESKQDAVLDLAGEWLGPDRKVVIFTGTHDACDALGRAAEKQKGPGLPAIWTAHGGTAVKQRQAILDAYRDHPGNCLLIGTWDAWGESIDGLQCTDACIAAMLPWNGGKMIQGEGRYTRGPLTGLDRYPGRHPRPFTMIYACAEESIDVSMISTLLPKLKEAGDVTGDSELLAAWATLVGIDSGRTEEEVARNILEKIGIMGDSDWDD